MKRLRQGMTEAWSHMHDTLFSIPKNKKPKILVDKYHKENSPTALGAKGNKALKYPGGAGPGLK